MYTRTYIQKIVSYNTLQVAKVHFCKFLVFHPLMSITTNTVATAKWKFSLETWITREFLHRNLVH